MHRSRRIPQRSGPPGASGASGSEADPVITRLCRPRRDRYRVLSVLWIFPSSGAGVILAVEGRAGLWRGFSLAALDAVPVHVWIALLLLLLHVVFMYLAYHYDRREPWHEVSFPGPGGPPEAASGAGAPGSRPSESESAK